LKDASAALREDAEEALRDYRTRDGKLPEIVEVRGNYFIIHNLNQSNKDNVKLAAEYITGKRVLLWNTPENPSTWVVHKKFVGPLVASGIFSTHLDPSTYSWQEPAQSAVAPKVDWSTLAPKRALRPFQQSGVEFLVPALCEPGKGAILADDQGLGKTIQSILVCMTYNQKVVVVCPAGVRFNWANEIFMTHPTWKVCVFNDNTAVRALKASFGINAIRLVKRPEASDVLIMSYEAARGIVCGNPDPLTSRYNTMKMVLAPMYVDLFKDRIIVLDECFPYETAVITDKGVMPIGYIVENGIACRVLSVDSSHNELCWRPVTAHYTKDSHERFVTIAHRHGTLRCTDNHPVWVEGKGYIRADSIKAGDRVRVVQVTDNQGPLLQHKLLGQVAYESSTHQGSRPCKRSQGGPDEQGPQQTGCQPSHEGAQSDALRSFQGEDAEDADRPTVLRDSWRKWKTDASTGSFVRGAEPRGMLGVPDQHEGSEVAEQASDVLQTGLGLSEAPRSNRGRWAVAPAPAYEGLGPQENICIDLIRVESVEIDQLGNNERPEGCRSKGEKVYCLEVEGTNNFFANGLLVHNCHYMKNVDAKRAQSALALCRGSNRVLCMTGTPICNRPIELWTLLCATGRNREVAGSAADFKASYVQGADYSGLNHRLVEGKFFLRRLKKDVLTELPPKQRQDFIVQMSPKQQLEYESLRQGLKTQVNSGGMSKNGTCILALLTNMQTLANAAKVAPVVEELVERTDEGYFTVVQCTRLEALRGIEAGLKEHGIQAKMLYGGSSDAERKDICTDFAAGKFPIVLTTLAEGINLQKADQCILLDLEWSPAKISQREDRIHRIGQSERVTIRRVLAASIDYHKRDVVATKQDMIDQVIDGGDSAHADDELMAEVIRRLVDEE
jgi:hypothetical protein